MSAISGIRPAGNGSRRYSLLLNGSAGCGKLRIPRPEPQGQADIRNGIPGKMPVHGSHRRQHQQHDNAAEAASPGDPSFPALPDRGGQQQAPAHHQQLGAKQESQTDRGAEQKIPANIPGVPEGEQRPGRQRDRERFSVIPDPFPRVLQQQMAEQIKDHPPRRRICGKESVKTARTTEIRPAQTAVSKRV